MDRVTFTAKRVDNINGSKKRPAKVLEWKRVAAKIRRNTGQPYISVAGVQKAGIPAPPGVRVFSVIKCHTVQVVSTHLI